MNFSLMYKRINGKRNKQILGEPKQQLNRE